MDLGSGAWDADMLQTPEVMGPQRSLILRNNFLRVRASPRREDQGPGDSEQVVLWCQGGAEATDPDRVLASCHVCVH